jgi:uncharacterized protein
MSRTPRGRVLTHALFRTERQSFLGVRQVGLKGLDAFLAHSGKLTRNHRRQRFLSAASRRAPLAQYNLGAMYARGQGVPQDFAQAFNWFGKAADQGNAYAQVSLGELYAEGYGAPQDYIQALMWSTLAISRGEDDATRELAANLRDRLVANMTPAQIAEAERMGREWFPK